MARARNIRRRRDRAAGVPLRNWLRRLLGQRAWAPRMKPIANLNQIRRIAYL